jgi:hypothetical protein
MKKVFGLVNKVVVFLSETPLHLLFSHQVMVLRFSGRRTRRAYAIPVSYGRDETTGKIVCMTDASGVWWKNLLSEDAIEITVKGARQGVSVRVEAYDQKAIAQALAGFCRRSRISAFFAGVSMVQGEPVAGDLEAAATRHVLIELSGGREQSLSLP